MMEVYMAFLRLDILLEEASEEIAERARPIAEKLDALLPEEEIIFGYRRGEHNVTIQALNDISGDIGTLVSRLEQDGLLSPALADWLAGARRSLDLAMAGLEYYRERGEVDYKSMFLLQYDNGTGYYDPAELYPTLQEAIRAAKSGWQTPMRIMRYPARVVWANSRFVPGAEGLPHCDRCGGYHKEDLKCE